MSLASQISALATRIAEEFVAVRDGPFDLSMPSKAGGTPPLLKLTQPDDTTDTSSAELIQFFHGAIKSTWFNEWGGVRVRIPVLKTGEAAVKMFTGSGYSGIPFGLAQDGASAAYNFCFHGDGSMAITKLAATPANASSGMARFYPKTDNLLYRKTDAGGELPVDASWEALPFSRAGVLTVAAGSARFPITGGTFTIQTVAAMVNTAPTGATVIVDVNKNGTTIYGTQGNRPTVATSATSATVGAHSVTTVTTGDYLTIDIDQIGSTIAGSDLVVVVRLQRTA